MTRILTDLSIRNDWMLRRLFSTAARGLPLARLAEIRRAYPLRSEASAEPEPLRRRSYGNSGS
jgi:hypothetical protein